MDVRAEYRKKYMIFFEEKKNEEIRRAWAKFVDHDAFDYSFLRPPILDSWKRSRNLSVNPHDPSELILTGEDLEKHIRDNADLIEAAAPYIDSLYSVLKGSKICLTLADKEGYIIKTVGDDFFKKRADISTSFTLGTNRREKIVGTNAIGTSLELARPIQIMGEEHYVEMYKKLTCSSAPIFNADNTLIGCLNLTGFSSEVHLHTLCMVISAVDGITNDLRHRKSFSKLLTMTHHMNKIIETIEAGVFLLNMDNKIIQTNSSALTILGLENRNVIGYNIFDFIRFDEADDENYSFVEQNIYNKDANIFIKKSKVPVKFNVSIDFVINDNGIRKGKVIRFTEPKQINKLVNRISGYKAKFTFSSIVGTSDIIQNMIRTCEKAAISNSNILILGESGTGKEMVAQAIHYASDYAQGPFVAINCGALPKGLVESELFGYEKGAFTGANKEGNPGKFELADGGTIFLDEIGDMPLEVQVSLLRVIDTREIVRIGGKHPRRVNVRIISATNRDLREAINDKTFREDLFYRLNVFSVKVPPLKHRGNDVTELAEHFIHSFSRTKKKPVTISPEVHSVLLKYPWPGNIRELENVMERAFNIIEDDTVIRLEHLPDSILHSVSENPHDPEIIRTRILYNHVQRNDISELIKSGLESYEGNIKRTAEALGLSRRTLYRKMEKYKINYSAFRK